MGLRSLWKPKVSIKSQRWENWFFKYFWGFGGSFCTPILQDEICQKNLGITEYVHFQTNVNFSIYLSAMGFRKNWHMSQNVHILRSPSFFDKCFLFNIFFLLKKIKPNYVCLNIKHNIIYLFYFYRDKLPLNLLYSALLSRKILVFSSSYGIFG